MNSSDRKSVLLYGDVNLNIIDGSSVWLTSIARVLATSGLDVHVLLKAEIENERLTQELRNTPRVTVIDAFTDTRQEGASEPRSLSPRYAARRLAELTSVIEPDLVLIRGINICRHAVMSAKLAKRLWAYVTEISHPDPAGNIPRFEELEEIVTGCNKFLVQTEDARSYIETIIPAASGKTLIAPPMVPDADSTPVHNDWDGTTALRLVYSGKFAKSWRTLEITEIPETMAASGVDVKLDLIGDKVHRESDHPGWYDQMRGRLDHAASGDLVNVSYYGGVPRSEAMEIASQSHIGVSWRAEVLDSSFEISTKVLEYASRGLAPLLNDTQAHRRLLGDDYPLLVSNNESAHDVLKRVAADPCLVRAAQQRAMDAIDKYRMSSVAELFSGYISRYLREPKNTSTGAPRVLVAGHDFKFATDLFEALAEFGADVRVDNWESLHRHDETASRELLEWADVIFCEWAGPNAVWYSKHKRDSQRLIVRLHRFEINAPWIRDIQRSRVNRFVFVSDYFSRVALDHLGWSEASWSVVPNSVDTQDLARAKNADSRFHLAIVGAVPMRKRPDLAVDLLEELLALDGRFVLHLRGRAPWDYDWEWRKIGLRDSYTHLLERMTSSSLRRSVSFDGFGPDIGNWLRGIGWVVSPSTDESFHLAPLEGMASGAVPLLWPRAGAGDIFGDRWVSNGDVRSMAADIVHRAQSSDWDSASVRAQEDAMRYDVLAVRKVWRELFSEVV